MRLERRICNSHVYRCDGPVSIAGKAHKQCAWALGVAKSRRTKTKQSKLLRTALPHIRLALQGYSVWIFWDDVGLGCVHGILWGVGDQELRMLCGMVARGGGGVRMLCGIFGRMFASLGVGKTGMLYDMHGISRDGQQTDCGDSLRHPGRHCGHQCRTDS